MTVVSTEEAAGSTWTFAAELAERARVGDVVAMVSVPVLLVGVFLLPEATRLELTFHYTEPTLLTAYTAHFVHLEASHLGGNLAGYLLLVSVCYALAVLSRRRRFFLTAFAAFLSVYPPLLSVLNLAVPRNAIGFGFSGINMALLGILPLLLVSYARRQFFPRLDIQHAPATFFLALAVVSLLALPTNAIVSDVAVASAAIGGLYLVSVRRSWHLSPRATLSALVARQGYGDLLLVALALFVAYPFVGFPTDVTGSGRVLNLYVHLLGFCLAFIGPYTLLSAGVFDTGDRG